MATYEAELAVTRTTWYRKEIEAESLEEARERAEEATTLMLLSGEEAGWDVSDEETTDVTTSVVH